MEHVVFYQSSQGTPAFRRVSSLEDAVSFAEHLRNIEGVTDFSVYSLAPVTLSLRAYYHVEVTGDAAPTTTTSAPAASTPPARQAEEPEAAPAGGSATTPDRYAIPDDKPTTSTTPQASAIDDATMGSPLPDATAEPAVIDPNVVDPTVEEVVPAGRRSMSFFARP